MVAAQFRDSLVLFERVAGIAVFPAQHSRPEPIHCLKVRRPIGHSSLEYRAEQRIPASCKVEIVYHFADEKVVDLIRNPAGTGREKRGHVGNSRISGIVNTTLAISWDFCQCEWVREE
jgi:hypothetical protein